MVRLKDRWLDARDRLLSDRRFQRWAAAFPLTRPIARRRAMQAFDLCAGFVYSQILQACVRLDVLQKLQGGPRTVGELAPEIGLNEESTRRLLLGAQALGLVSRRGARGADDTYGLGATGAAFLANPGIARMIEHHAVLYRDLADPVALLRDHERQTELSRYWAYVATRDPAALAVEDVAAYTDLMASSQSLVCEEILDAYDLGAHRCLLDVGGGNGTFLAAAAIRAPRLQLVLFDLPAVVAGAGPRLAELGLQSRARVVGGDFGRDPLPKGADLISFVRVLHDHGDTSVDLLLRKARDALEPGGRILIAEPMAATRGAERVGDAYFGFYLAAMRSGRPRSAGELAAMLQRNGFRQIRHVPTHLPLQTSVISAAR